MKSPIIFLLLVLLTLHGVHPVHAGCTSTVVFSQEVNTDGCRPSHLGVILTIRYHFCFFLTYRVRVCRSTQARLDRSLRRSKRCIRRRVRSCDNHPNVITCGVEIVQACTDGRFVSDY